MPQVFTGQSWHYPRQLLHDIGETQLARLNGAVRILQSTGQGRLSVHEVREVLGEGKDVPERSILRMP